MKTLIIRLGAIGDVVNSTIIADMIKSKYKESIVDFLTSDFLVDFLKYQKSIDNVFSFKISQKNNPYYILKKGLELRKNKYDNVFVLTNSARSFLLTQIIKPKNKITRYAQTSGIKSFYKTALKFDESLQMPTNLNFIVPKLDNDMILNSGVPVVIFAPCGLNDKNRQGRIWRDTNWIELGNKLSEKYNAQILITGSKQEKNDHQIYKKIKNAKILSGELSLSDSAKLFATSDLLISGDSGPLHIAAAVGTKCIGLMGSTSPYFCAPFGEGGYVIDTQHKCKHCGLKKCKHLSEGEKYTPCMDDITPQRVVEFIEKEGLLSL